MFRSTAGQVPRKWSVSPPSPTTGWSDDQQVPEAVAEALLAGIEVEAGGMPEPRTSTALRQLTDLGRDPARSRWSWAVRAHEPGGRLRLPADAQAAIGFRPGASVEVRGRCQRVGLVIAPARPRGAR